MTSHNLASELIVAVKKGNKERCQELLSQGADVNGKDDGVSSEATEIGGNSFNSSCELYFRVAHRFCFCFLSLINIFTSNVF